MYAAKQPGVFPGDDNDEHTNSGSPLVKVEELERDKSLNSLAALRFQLAGKHFLGVNH